MLDASHSANQAVAINNSGVAVGYADYLNSDEDDAWMFNSSTATLTTFGYSAPNFYGNMPKSINDAGAVLGSSELFSGSNSLGGESWYYTPQGGAQLIGLLGPTYTGSNGQVNDVAFAMNQNGQCIGYSGIGRFEAWQFTPGQGTVQIGLADTSTIKYTSTPDVIDNVGDVAGTSNNPASSPNTTYTWFYSAATGTTTTIGFYDAAHTQSNGTATNAVGAIGSAGLVAGYTNRTGSGRDAWLYSPATGTTTIIGLQDALHESSGGPYNVPAFVNSLGEVAGYAQRYSATTGGLLGDDAWVYDSRTGQTYDLFASQSSTGYAYSVIDYLSNDGTAVGSYYDYAADGVDYTADAFRWSESGGFVDLGPLVLGGYTSSGLLGLNAGTGETPSGQIIGYGGGSAAGRYNFILTPVPVPEPAILPSICAATLTLCGRRRAPQPRC